MAKAKKTSGKFSVVNNLHERLTSLAQTTKSGEVKIKRTELKKAIEDIFAEGAKRAASGERVRFPIVGALVSKEVKARKAGKGTNPFTGEPMTIKARPASKKPRWSFPKALKETFANKKNW
jgi:DNA-binding protein HU-beta